MAKRKVRLSKFFDHEELKDSAREEEKNPYEEKLLPPAMKDAMKITKEDAGIDVPILVLTAKDKSKVLYSEDSVKKLMYNDSTKYDNKKNLKK